MFFLGVGGLKQLQSCDVFCNLKQSEQSFFIIMCSKVLILIVELTLFINSGKSLFLPFDICKERSLLKVSSELRQSWSGHRAHLRMELGVILGTAWMGLLAFLMSLWVCVCVCPGLGGRWVCGRGGEQWWQVTYKCAHVLRSAEIFQGFSDFVGGSEFD